ncbi:WbqC family protein [Fusobacterium mortiferum]|uniref:WbqC family protein n=1 Tax=Fusobacterium mortiferum TaxID=850 RepID=UPI001F27D675|nr:WbqC family protein [Fusobacterium mortiferum]MCF2628527.1 WbqC family protein [Fusobacterium mortiferum]
MKIGIMQPYFIPYIGYWQLLNAVDKYVIYDDVNYINRGWINRNRILLNGEDKMITLSLKEASQNKLIKEIELVNNKKERMKILKTISQSYQKAPFYDVVYPLIEEILNFEEVNLGKFLENSIRKIAEYLEINTTILISSEIEKDNMLKGKDKILNICKKLRATKYYNAIGGQELYSYEEFKKNGIELNFLKTSEISYIQYRNNFIPNLSILDVMMFNSKKEIKKYLEKYELL